MRRNSLAILAVLVGTLGACGGRSTLRINPNSGDAGDSLGLADVKLDIKLDTPASADVANLGDAPADATKRDNATADTPIADSARTDLAADAPRTDVTVAPDTRDGGVPEVGGTDGRGDAAPTLVSIELTPPSPTIQVKIPYTGLVVTALMSDGTTADVTAAATYASSDATVIQISGHSLTGLTAGSATVTATYQGKTATAKVTVMSSPLQSISIDGVAPVSVGQFILVTATGVFADGTKQDITAQAAWTSSDITLATVAIDGASSKEKVTGIKAGALSITAVLQGITGKAAITVTAATITRIDITPAQPILQRGVSQQFQATATFSDGTTGDVTAQATWGSSNAAIATVTSSSTGVVVRALATGSTTISATVGTVTGSTSVTVTAATLLSIVLTPTTWSPNVGAAQNFVATGTYSDNTKADVTLSATWASTNATAFSVSNAAGQKGLATALAVGAGQVQATLSGVTGSATVTVSASPLVSIAITPNPLSLVLGLKGSLVATGTYQNGTTQILTTQVAWVVTDPTIASVSNAASTAGLVSGIAVGSTSVIATLSGISSKAIVNIFQAKLTTITVAPATTSVTAGASQQFTATGTYDNGSTPDITTQVTWSSSNTGVAQVSNAAGSNGLATSLVAGRSTIIATMSGVSGTATLTVGAPLLSSVMIAPSSASIEVGATQAFIVTAVFQNGTTAAVAGTWASSNAAVATIAAGGAGRRAVATGVGAGTTSIMVTYQGLTDSALLTVTAVPTLVGLTVTPANPPSILVGATQQFQATAVFSDGSINVVTGTASWTTSSANVASVSNGGGGPGGGGRGLATGIGAGTTTITATYRGFTATTSLTVRNPTPIGLLVTPSTASVFVNGTQQFTASVTMDDGTSQTVTNAASWTTSNGAIASIRTGGGGPGGGGGRGLATGIAAGTVTITATYSGFTAVASLTVSAATPSRIVVTPNAPSIQVGLTQAFAATLVYSDNTIAVVTAQATWSSSDASVATITTAGGGPGGGGGGTATALAAGSAIITATYGGLSGTAKLTVTDPTLAYVQVTPTNPSIPAQAFTQLTATAVFTDNSTRNVTALATWSSSNTSVAVVANSGGTIGRATALAEGTSTITATYRGSSGTTLLTVAASVLSIAVTPANPTTVLGLPVPFVATALLSNNATLVVTGNASWVSSDPTVATATAAGVATPVKAGSATIKATYLGQSGASTLTVSKATLSSIAVTPNPLSLASGGSQQLTATGTYDDATTRDLTSAATWLSSTPAVAVVSNANGSHGLLTAIGSGSTTVTAAFQGVSSASDSVTVP
jgi:trimeric autotransporter adhesin